MAALRGVPAWQARPEPRSRRQPAPRRPRDGPAPRPRPLHPPQRGRQHLGGAGVGHHRVKPGREGPVLQAVRRQGVPPPDVLRHPRRRPAHLRGGPMNTADTTPATPTDTTSTDDNPYDLLAQDHDEGHRWAFGTGFADPLSGIDTSVPEQLDPHALARWCLALGDDALIYSHRL